jgi:hypothetical protein
MPILRCSELKRAVAQYNSGEYRREDLALAAALVAVQSLPWSLGRLMEVCLVADWGRIQNFSFTSRIAMAAEIERSWPLLQQIRNFSPARRSSQLVVSGRIVNILEKETRLLAKLDKKTQLSFVSKYLHLCVNDAFPIWDSLARTALSQTGDQRTWSTYIGWLNIIRQEVEDHKACCLPDLRLPGESLVRTLDKALYILGKPKDKPKKRAKKGV